ncbi:MAG TPA: YidB family protein [Myxococcota bacterium]|nr:YidB family protein [Myxococcota bacterium]
MGLLETLSQQVKGALGSSGGDPSGLVAGVLNTIQSKGTRGLGSFVQDFHDKGLGSVVSSWIGTGPNQPITAAQVENVLGTDRVRTIAGKLGLPPAAVTTGLAAVLPHVIDRLTPEGRVPAAGAPNASRLS